MTRIHLDVIIVQILLSFFTVSVEDGKITQKSEFETTLRHGILVEIKNGGYSLEELSLLWLYCKAWGAHGEHILSFNGFWKFTRDNLRKVLFDLTYPDPSEASSSIQSSSELVDLLKAKLEIDNRNLYEWLNLIYQASFELIPKCEFKKNI